MKEILMMEYEKTYEKMLNYEEQANKTMETLFTAIGIIMTICTLCYSNLFASYTLIIAPFILSLSLIILNFMLIFMLLQVTKCIRTGGYLKYLENELNQQVGKDVLVWENRIACKYIHKRSTTIGLYILIGMFFIMTTGVIIWIGCTRLWTTCRIFANILFVFLVLELITTILMLIDNSKAHEDTYLAAITGDSLKS